MLCCNGEAISTRFRRITSHSKIATYDESYCQDAIVRVVLDFSKPGEEKLRKSRSMEFKEDRSGRPDKGTDLFEASDHYYHEQFMESFSSTDYSKLDYDRAWSSQEWTAEVRRTIDQCNLVKLHGEWYNKFVLITQSVRYGEPLRDRSGQPDNVNSQEAANSQNFIMGSDATEFVNRANDQVRKRQKRMSNVAGEGEEHSMVW